MGDDTCGRRCTPIVMAIALALGSPAYAADESPDAAVLAQLERMSGQLARQQVEIDRLRGQLEALEEQELARRGRGMTAGGDPAASGVAASQAFGLAEVATAQAAAPQGTDPQVPVAGPPRDPAAVHTPAQPPIQVGQARREEDAERREQERALVVREHAPLFERRFTLDAGVGYSYYDRRQLALSGFLALDAIFLGTINLDQTKASVMTLDLSGRYGLTDRLSVEGNLPYVYRDTRFVSGGAGGASNVVSEVQLTSSGIGDASVAGYYQWVKESARWPDLVTSLRVRGPSGRSPFGLKLIQPDGDNNNLNVPENLPTGTGVWSVTANVSALRTYDPVILFGNVGYTYNRPQDFDDISPVLGQVSPGEVALGAVIQLSGGLAIALNDRSAISFSVASAFAATTRTRAPGGEQVDVPGSSSNTTTLNIGASYALPSGWTLNGQLAAGLTPDAPNFVFGLRASHSF
ncbi:MAG: transporter [Pseudomonadota bacterium]|nr:transporter [Pseudomonadota bacterium]